jgi:ribosomal protein L7/L12
MSGMTPEELGRLYTLEAKVYHLEALIQVLLARLGINPSEVEPQAPSPNQNIQAALMRGNKIEAIKLYQDQTGVGLKEARNYIDALERQMRG